MAVASLSADPSDQRLVDFVGERRGNLAHLGQARDVGQLGLKFLQAMLGLLALGQVAQKAGEHPVPVPAQLTDVRALTVEFPPRVEDANFVVRRLDRLTAARQTDRDRSDRPGPRSRPAE
jgi:hypothetical protein